VRKQTQKIEEPPKCCQECEHWQDMKQRLEISELLERAISNIEAKLQSADFKPSWGDYFKLLQMKKDVEAEAPKEIKVTWVEPMPVSEQEK
jgi:hypothetical protein